MNQEMRQNLARRAVVQAERVRVQCNVQLAAPVDPITIAEKRGCDVIFQSLPSLEGVYSPEPRPTVVLGAQRPAGRRAFNCAHELGHHEFKHGMRLDEFNARQFASDRNPDELLADMFAGFLLMAKDSVVRALRRRNLTIATLTPDQVFRLASFFGVGYNTILNHMTWSLELSIGNNAKDCVK